MSKGRSVGESEGGKVGAVSVEVERTRAMMAGILAGLLERGEKLESLVPRAETLAGSAAEFHTMSGRVKRAACWGKWKWTAIGVGIVAVVVVLGVASAFAHAHYANHSEARLNATMERL